MKFACFSNINSLRWLPTVSSKVKKCKFQPQKLPMDISEKNETKVMHWITFKASSTSIDKVLYLLLWQQWRIKMAEHLHPIYFANEFGDPWFFLH